MLRITARVSGLQEAIRKLNDIESAFEDERDEAVTDVMNEVAGVWGENFAREGALDQRWPALAAFTVQDRIDRGFNGTHPILVRSGGLRDLVVDFPSTAKRSGTMSRSDNYNRGLDWVDIQVSKDGRATLKGHGWKISNQWDTRGDEFGHPARPYWFDNALTQTASRKAIEEWVKDVVQR